MLPSTASEYDLIHRHRNSLFLAMAMAASVGLLVPALVIGGLLIGWHDPRALQEQLNAELKRKLDVLSSSLPELLWNMDRVAAAEVVDAMMESPDVVSVQVTDGADDDVFLERDAPERGHGHTATGERDILRGAIRIGHLRLEIDDDLAEQDLVRQRWMYGATVGMQLLGSLLLILLLLNNRVMKPLRALGHFANHLAQGRFDAEPAHSGADEIGLLGQNLVQMRDALQTHFNTQKALIDRLRHVSETVPGVIFQLQLPARGHYRFIYVSEKVQDFLHVSANEVLQRAPSFFERIHAADRDRVLRSLNLSAQAMHAWQQEFRSTQADGGERWIYGHALPSKDKQGGVLWYGFLTDISRQRLDALELDRHRHHLEDLVAQRTHALALAREEAETANRSKSAFLANMSHEIRTPLNAIIGLTYLVQRDCIEPTQRKRLTKVVDAAEHLLRVINNVLDFSKIEAGKLQLDLVDFKVQQVLDKVVGILAHKAAESNLQLRLDLDAALSELTLIGDAQRISEILLNFAGNALKFTETGFVQLSVRIMWREAKRVHLIFEVSDSGIGITESAQLRLFQNFEQADSSTTRRFGGSGLGLAISRRLAELMGGDVGVQSVSEQGSRFWLELTLEIQTPAKAVGKTLTEVLSENNLDELRGHRLLLVEDNLVNQEVALALLEHAGLAVELAENGQRACELVAERDYALILMDVQMPVMDGLDATRRIRAMTKGAHIPILAMTANAFADERQRCLDAGMNDHVAKPVRAEQLFKTLKFWLGQNQSLD